MTLDVSKATYRVAFESFSKLSRKVSEVSTHEKLVKHTGQYLKLLFNFVAMRVTIVDKRGHYTSAFPTAKKIDLPYWNQDLLDFESELLDKQIPFCRDYSSNDVLDLSGIEVKDAKIWGWAFTYDNLTTITTLIADSENAFTVKQVEILRLVIDVFTLKFAEINAKKELEDKNAQLYRALNLVQVKNERINQIINDQQLIIEERTEKIRMQNKQLRRLSVLNAHKVREPLSRVMGLIQLAEHVSEKELKEDLLVKIQTSAQDLDKALQMVIEKSLNEISEDLEI